MKKEHMKTKLIFALIFFFAVINYSEAELVEECGNANFMAGHSDYIIEATVEKVTSAWNKERDTILSHVYLNVDHWLKGAPLPGNKLKIIVRSGCIGKVCNAVEDEPDPDFFQQGKRIRAYLENVDSELKLLCGFMGTQEIKYVDMLSRVEKARAMEDRFSDKEAFMLKARLIFAPETIDPASEFALKPGEKLQADECGTGFYKELHRVFPQLTAEEKELLGRWDPSCKDIIKVREQEDTVSKKP